MQIPVGIGPGHLLIEIERNIVLNEYGAGRGASGGILRHLGKFELSDRRVPFADRLLKGGAKARGEELPHHFRLAIVRHEVRSRAPHENDFHETFQQRGRGRIVRLREANEDLIPLGRRASGEIVNANRAAVRKRKRNIGAGNEHSRLAGCSFACKDHSLRRKCSGEWHGRRGRTIPARVPAKKVPKSPDEMPRNRRNTGRAQHEIVQVLIDRQEIQRREDERQQPHSPERHIGDKHYTGKPDRFALKPAAATREIFQKATAIANPLQIGPIRRKFRNHVERQMGKNGAHSLNQQGIQIVRAGCEGNLDFWPQNRNNAPWPLSPDHRLSCYNRASFVRTVDLAIIAAYLAGVTWLGARFKQSQTTLKDYFLGGRTAPWWAIALSIVSAETSTLTIIGTPPLAYAGSYVFSPGGSRISSGARRDFHHFSSALLRRPDVHRLRADAEKIRPACAKSLIGNFSGDACAGGGCPGFRHIHRHFDHSEKPAASRPLRSLAALTLFYTFEGGMTAVIWTDVVQMCMYVVGAAVSLFVLTGKIPGGLSHALDLASAAGKLQVFDLQWSWAKPYTIWAGFIGGCFLTTASHGTDQLVVQRLLSAKNQSQSRAALFASWIVIFIQFTLFLTIGMLLWVYHNGQPPAAQADRLYPSFIWQSLPVGIAGLAMAAIIAAAMANLSAALNSLASATVVDFYAPLTKSLREPAHYLKMARLSTVFWGVVLGAIALVASQWGSVLESGLRIASITLGILLGLFLFGLLTKKPGENAAIAGVIAGLAAMLYVKFVDHHSVHMVGDDRERRHIRRRLYCVVCDSGREKRDAWATQLS